VSRIPRFQENLKTGFTAEAVSAARYRAFARKAEQDGHPHLAQRWLRLAAAKDQLAIDLLVAAEQVWGEDRDLGLAISEERYENDVLYPKIVLDDDSGRLKAIFTPVLETQNQHLKDLEALRIELNGSNGDVKPPTEEKTAVKTPVAPVAATAGRH
jgi:rubrerythrin